MITFSAGNIHLTLLLLRSSVHKFNRSEKIRGGICDMRLCFSKITVKFESPTNSLSLRFLILLLAKFISIISGNWWKMLGLRKSILLSVIREIIEFVKMYNKICVNRPPDGFWQIPLK